MRDLSGQSHSPRSYRPYNTPSRGKKFVHFLLSLALFASALRLEQPVQAGTSLAVTPSGKDYLSCGSRPTWHTEQ
jgi:hypothetical protein